MTGSRIGGGGREWEAVKIKGEERKRGGEDRGLSSSWTRGNWRRRWQPADGFLHTNNPRMIGQAEAKEQVAAGALKREWGVECGEWEVGRDYTSAVEGGAMQCMEKEPNRE